MPSKAARPMIGATNETGFVNGFAPSPDPAMSRTARKPANPMLSPQTMS